MPNQSPIPNQYPMLNQKANGQKQYLTQVNIISANTLNSKDQVIDYQDLID
jgi:hypothetical protein